MNLYKWSIILVVVNCVLSSKVYEWKNDWGSSLSTREFAQVHDTDKTIIHYSTDEGALSKSSPAVSMYDFQFTNSEFDKGILAIRPLMSDGNQLCFISEPRKIWTKTVTNVIQRHGTVVSAPASYKLYKLKRSFPADLDPLSVQSIADFCNVDSEHMFYMDPAKSAKDLRKLKIHGLHGRLTVGIPDYLVDRVFALKDDHGSS